MIYSFMLSCKANGVNPEEWLMDVLEKINDTKKSELINLLPNNWKKNKITQQ
jgi:transposase